ncbi:MAG: DUF6446 family protein [Pseudomonadota bacterium]
MTSGKILAVALLVGTAAVGIGAWYTQTRAWYQAVEAEAVTLTRRDGAEEALAVAGFEGVDAATSPLRFRACFTTDLDLGTLDAAYMAYPDATPLNAPGWFGCFDAGAIGAALEAGEAQAFLGRQNAPYGFDMVVAVTEAGQGFAWPQLNRCGEAAFGGDPLPPGCPPAPGGGG